MFWGSFGPQHNDIARSPLAVEMRVFNDHLAHSNSATISASQRLATRARLPMVSSDTHLSLQSQAMRGWDRSDRRTFSLIRTPLRVVATDTLPYFAMLIADDLPEIA
jgi:hypothetical protein